MMTRRPYISLVIPVYNEALVIEENVLELQKYMESYVGKGGWEIVLVNDGSTDETRDILDRLERDFARCKAVHHPVNLGRGKALRSGFEAANGEIIVTLDADLSYAPYHIERMVQALEERNVDIVLASAYHPKGSAENVPWFRLLISRLGNLMLSRFFKEVGGFHTWTCIVRAFRSSVVKSMDLTTDDKELHLEILRKAKLLGFTIAEVPAELKWRKAKVEKMQRTRRRKPKFFLGKTSKSHMGSSFVYRPGPLFAIPVFLLFAILVYTSTTLVVHILPSIFRNETGVNIYVRTVRAVSHAYEAGAASFYVAGIALISLIQLMFFYLLNRQLHSYYVDIYSFLNKQCNRCPLDEKKAPVGGESLSGKIGDG